jgi:hypothetical protein
VQHLFMHARVVVAVASDKCDKKGCVCEDDNSVLLYSNTPAHSKLVHLRHEIARGQLPQLDVADNCSMHMPTYCGSTETVHTAHGVHNTLATAVLYVK